MNNYSFARQTFWLAILATTLISAPLLATQPEDKSPEEAPRELPQVIELFESQRDQVVSILTELSTPAGLSPFFGFRDGEPARGQGSGFVVDADGLVVTNWHVVSGAQSIQVSLADGSLLPAILLGADPATDIALLQVEGATALSAVTLGQVSDMRPGEWVVAIGSPFGLDHSVTVGVLSALGRKIGMGPYDNFLQTDASINPGNSGGPLFNLKGEVVGVNTAIIRNGRGIGFAVPIDVVIEILPQLREQGHVVRGFIGANLQDMSVDLAETYGLTPRDGVLVRSVDTNGPAHRAGLRAGDIVTRFSDIAVEDTAGFLNTVARIAPGETTEIVYRRNQQERRAEVTVAERPDPDRQEIERTRERAQTVVPGRLGVTLRPLSATLASRTGSPPGVGLYVDRVEAGSPASGVLHQGDVILQVADVDVSDPSQVPPILRDQGEDRPIRMLIRRRGEPHFVAVRLKPAE
jgi:serine protease Do